MRVKKARRRMPRQEYIPDAPRQAAPSGARLRAQHSEPPPFGQPQIPIPSDAEVERKYINGGFNTSKTNVCKTCFMARSKNKSCGCTSKISDASVRKLSGKRAKAPGI